MKDKQVQVQFCPILSNHNRKCLESRGSIRMDPVLGMEKRCTSCKEWWPMDTEFFMYTGGRLESWCRACSQEIREFLRNRVDKSVPAPRYKACAELRE